MVWHPKNQRDSTKWKKITELSNEYTTPRRHAIRHLWRGTGEFPVPWRRETNWDSKQQISGVMPMMYEFDGYDEILKCYEGETDIHASTSFEVGLMNDLYYQLFYNYDN